MRHLPGPAARLREVRAAPRGGRRGPLGGVWVESADAAIVLLLECVSSRKCGSVTEALEADVAMAWVGTVLSDLGVLARCLVRLTRREGPCSGTEAPRLLGVGSASPSGVASLQPSAHGASGSRLPPGTQNCHMASRFFQQGLSKSSLGRMPKHGDLSGGM